MEEVYGKHASQQNKSQSFVSSNVKSNDNGRYVGGNEMFDSDEERARNGELFSAIRKGNLNMVRSLLEDGVKTNIIDRNNKNNTPLQYAVEKNKREIVEELLNSRWKTDINAKNSEDKSALDIAERLDCDDIVQILKSHIQLNQEVSVEEQPARDRPLQENLIYESSSGQYTQSSNQLRKLTLKQNSKKYKFKKRPGTTGGLDGHWYEIDLLILGMLRGYRDTYKFYLASNMDGVGAFDDAVIRYWKSEGKEKSQTIFLQAKHVDNSKRGKVTIEKLKNPKNDGKFYLVKYFLSYLQCREKFNGKSNDPIFNGNFKELDLRYIIYTNAVLDEEFEKDRKIDVDGNIFSTKSRENKDKAFKLSFEAKKNVDLIKMLTNVACQERIKSLAKALVNCIHGKLNYNNMMGNAFFSTYHICLSKNVIEVKKERKKGEKGTEYREGKINHTFLESDSTNPLEKELREEILYEYAENVVFSEKANSGLGDKNKRNDLVSKLVDSLKSSGKVDDNIIRKLSGNVIVLDKKTRKLKFADHDNRDNKYKPKDEITRKFMKELTNKIDDLSIYIFDIPYELIKQELEERVEKEPLKLHVNFGNINPGFKKPDHLIGKLIELFKQYKSQKVIKIDDSMVGHGKILTDGDIINIGKLVGHLPIFDQKEKMVKLVNEESLSGDVLKLIKKLKIAAESDGLIVDDYRFDIKVKNFPRESLVNEDEDRANAEEFFSKLELFVGQASDEELKDIIKDEMRDLYKLTKNEVEESFLKIRNKALEFWRKCDDYLEKNDDSDFFKNIVKFNIKFDVKEPVAFFTGRDKTREELHKILQDESSVNKIQRVASIAGLGGTGKSELARKYISEHSDDYDGNIIWINAQNYQTLVESFYRLAKDKLEISVKRVEGEQKDIKSIVEDVYQFFTKRKSLFIFDNAEKLGTQNDDEGIDTFLPSLSSNANKPFVLITSHNQKWGDRKVILLGPFAPKEAAELIRTALNIKGGSQGNKIQELAETLQYFPLALQQAIAYIKQADEELKSVNSEGGFEIDDYLQEYKMKAKELLDFPFPDDSDNKYTKTTFTTWQTIIDKISGYKKCGEKALEILNTIAYCIPHNIPVKMFLKLEENERKLGTAVQLLKKYSVIDLEEDILSVHRLVQEVTRINLKDQKREEETLRNAFGLFQDGTSAIDLFLNNNLHIRNVEHAMSIWSYTNKHEDSVREFSSFPTLIVSQLRTDLRFEEACSFGSNALKLLKGILGDNHPSVLSIMNQVASVLYDQGKDNKALNIYQELERKLDIINKLVAPVGVIMSFETMIGLILARQGKDNEALKIFLRQQDLTRNGLSILSPIIFSDGSREHNIGLVLSNQGKLDEGMKMFRVALKKKEETSDPDYKSILNTKNSISAVLEMQGKYEDALKLSWEVYEGRKEILGEEHPDTLTVYYNIALTLSKQGKYNEALRISNAVLQKRKELLPDHPRTLKTMWTIAGILELQGNFDEALEKLKEVYEKKKRILGPNHLDTLTVMDNWYGLAVKLAKQCKYYKALKELNEILEERKKIFELNHSSILQIDDAIRKVRSARDNGYNIDYVTMDQRLYLAVEKGHLEVVNRLLKENIDANGQDAAGNALLHLAAENGHARVLEKLLEKVTKINAKTIIGSTALHIAVHRGYLDVVTILLNRGADVNCYDNALFRPLHFAAQEGHIEIVGLLLKNGANIEATNVYGLTSLCVAVAFKYSGVVNVLLEGGADIDTVNNMMPSDYKYDELIKKVLLSTKQLPNAIKQKYNESKIQRLLEDGAVINYFSGTNRLTSLHYAVSGGNVDIVRLLLRKKPDVNVADEDGWTPLHYAAQDGHLEIVQLLLDNRADPSIPNDDRKKPIQLAQERLGQNSRIYQKIIDILKSKLLNQKQELFYKSSV